MLEGRTRQQTNSGQQTIVSRMVSWSYAAAERPHWAGRRPAGR
jgi:hypothetical protein